MSKYTYKAPIALVCMLVSVTSMVLRTRGVNFGSNDKSIFFLIIGPSLIVKRLVIFNFLFPKSSECFWLHFNSKILGLREHMLFFMTSICVLFNFLNWFLRAKIYPLWTQNSMAEVMLMTIAHQIVLFEPILTTCFFFYMVSTLCSISLELYNVQPIAVK